MIGTVQEKGLSKNGKPKIKIDGKWYFAGRCDISQIYPKNVVEFSSSTFGEGGKFNGLESIVAAANTQPAQSKAAEPSPYIDEAEMRFISNVVGSAITAKSCDSPDQVLSWAKAAQGALHALKTPMSDESENPADF